MAKGRRTDFVPRGNPGMGGGGMNPSVLQKMQQMQEDMRRTQEELESELINYVGAGGAINIVISGHQRVQSIKIDPEMIDPNDAGALEDALVVAVNEAIIKSQEHSAKRMESVTGGVNIPGLM
jgi:nucleoid-associated protein EbfC